MTDGGPESYTVLLSEAVAREFIAWANRVNSAGANLSREQVTELLKLISAALENMCEDRREWQD